MNEQHQIYFAMYAAFLEIREGAHTGKLGPAKILADLFHNVPLQMEQASKGKKSYASILEYIVSRADELHCGKWLRDILVTAAQNMPKEPE